MRACRRYRKWIRWNTVTHKATFLLLVARTSGLTGKTTLLNCLGGRSPSFLNGVITLNGIPWRKAFKHQVAYVLQADRFFEHQTPREQLIFTARLRLRHTEYPTVASKIERVDKMIAVLGLTKCQNTPVAMLSGQFGYTQCLLLSSGTHVIASIVLGGEKRRCSIATELLSDPPLLLLDEPTSGLDSSGALALMTTLRMLASEGRTIIMSLHQPSSKLFQSFDSVYVLADGHTIYSGAPRDTAAYFSAYRSSLPRTLQCKLTSDTQHL